MDRWNWRVLGAMLAATSAMAAEPVRVDPALDLQRQQQEQRLQQQLTAPRPALLPSTPPVSAPSSPSTACVPVRQVQVQGSLLLTPETLSVLVAPYEGRCLAQADISQLMQLINAAYLERGFITSRAYLPEQTVNAGILQLQVIEGVVETLLLNGQQDGVAGRRLAAAFPTKPGRKLRLQDIEQGVDQINRALSAQATVALEPGDAPGGTRVLVKTRDERSWRAGLYGDNSGEAATGRLKFTATLDKDNLFEVNDSWQLAFSRSERSRAFSLSPVLPFGYWTLNASYSRSDYRNPLGNGYTLNGDSQSALVNVERLVFRNQTEQLSLLAGVADRDSGREIAGVTLQPDETATARIGLRWLHREPAAATWYLQAAYVRGLDWFDATRDAAGLPESYPHHQFGKLDLQGQYSRALAGRWQYTTQLQAQYSGTGLVGGEQIVLGGNDSLRGFATSSSYGDSGISWRNQLGSACWPDIPRLQCFAFADAGIARARMAPPVQQLAGGGLGARIDYPHFFGLLSAGLPLYASDAVKTEGLQVYVQLGAHY